MIFLQKALSQQSFYQKIYFYFNFENPILSSFARNLIKKMKIKEEIIKLIENVLEELKINNSEKIFLEHPDILDYGDYSCNIAMILAKKEDGKPREFAEQIRAQIQKKLPEEIEKIEVAGSGFINFYLSKKFYTDFLNKKKYFENISKSNFNNKKILLEHSSPNLFKPFHIGHLVNNSIGESIGRILKFSGIDVQQISFPSDISPGIAKTIWSLNKKNIDLKNLNLQQIAESYVFGTEQYREENNKKEINQININLYKNKKDNYWNIYQIGRELSLKHFQEITKRLGSEFSDLIFESEAEKIGKEIIQKNIGKVFKKSEGAIIFEGSKYGLFDNVFVNSAGFGTYLAKDIGLLKIKFNKFDFNKSITISDNEQKQHFQLVKKSAELINKNWSEKSIFLQHGRMSFIGDIKISSRYGNVPLVVNILEQLEEKILEKNQELDNDNIKKIAIASLKYSILKVSTGKNIIFDAKKSLDFSGNSGPYLQYAYVRANSILEKARVEAEKLQSNFSASLKKKKITNLEKLLYRFPEEVEKSLESYSPHHLANYLYNLASEFNSFYAQTKILDQKNEDYQYNLVLTTVFAKTIKKGLNLLGIETVEKM